jgi:hypothetical protein
MGYVPEWLISIVKFSCYYFRLCRSKMALQLRKMQANVQIMALNNRITLKLTIMWYSGAQNGRLNFVRWHL